MGSFSLNGTFTACPDPDYQSYPIGVRGAFVGGGIVRQGQESGMLKFPPLTSGMRNELVARWNANKQGLVGGALPNISGYGWGTVTAAWGEITFTGFDGEFAHGGSMLVYKVTRY